MAKVYETEKDVVREDLRKEAHSQRHAQNDWFNMGMLLNALGLLHLSSTMRTREPGANSIGESFSERHESTINTAISGTFILGGLAFLVKSFFVWKDVKKKEAKIKELGPEEVVYPKTMTAGQVIEGIAVLAREDHAQRLTKSRDAASHHSERIVS